MSVCFPTLPAHRDIQFSTGLSGIPIRKSLEELQWLHMHKDDTWNKMPPGIIKSRIYNLKWMNYTLKMYELYTVRAGHVQQRVPLNVWTLSV